jgi:membrane fusion protein (multidrug efflux system)
MSNAVVLMILICSLIVSSCAKKTEEVTKPSRAHLVEVVTAEKKIISVERERTGTLRAIQEIQIYNQEEGRITDLPFYEGDKVKTGDVVARLDDRLVRAQLMRTQALRRKAEKDLQRISGLANKQLTAQTELTRVETELAVAKADEQSLLTQLDYATLRSPINGVVSQRLSEPGNIAERYTHLLTVSDQSQLITEVTVSELLINKLRQGDPVTLQIDALEQSQQNALKGVINRIHPNLDPITRNGVVEVSINPVPVGARPGQLARVTLRSQEAERLLIPFVALRRSSEGEYVFIIDAEQKAQRAMVVSGLRIDDRVEVLQGLSAGQQVVIRGFTNLRPNMTVTLVSARPSVDDQGRKPVAAPATGS